MRCARFVGRSGTYPDLPGFAAEDIDVRSAASEAGKKAHRRQPDRPQNKKLTHSHYTREQEKKSMVMTDKQYYPGTDIRITSPFFLHICTVCGKRQWSVLGNLEQCPECGGKMELRHDT